MAYLKNRFLLVLLAVIFASVPAHAGMLDFLNGGTESAVDTSKELSECGKSVDTFRKFMRDGKICKKDDDCVSVPGFCPIGCKIFVNKIFEGILQKRMSEVASMCSDSVCSYKCAKETEESVCVENHCVEKR